MSPFLEAGVVEILFSIFFLVITTPAKTLAKTLAETLAETLPETLAETLGETLAKTLPENSCSTTTIELRLENRDIDNHNLDECETCIFEESQPASEIPNCYDSSTENSRLVDNITPYSGDRNSISNILFQIFKIGMFGFWIFFFGEK